MKGTFVHDPPVSVDSIGGYPELGELPNEWLGDTFDWKAGYAPKAVFIGQLDVGVGQIMGTEEPNGFVEIYLFAYKLDLTQGGCKNPNMQEGYFIEYVLVEKGKQTVFHRLRQSESVTFAKTMEDDDYLVARDFDWKKGPHLDRLPKWKPSEAYWPTCDGKPMTFLKQWHLPENDVTRQHLTFDEYNFLFAAWREGRLVFKVTTQNVDLQTAEEHYREEEERFKQQRKKGKRR